MREGKKKTIIVTHQGPDADSIAGRYILKKSLTLENDDFEDIVVPPGERIEIKAEDRGFVFHIDTGRIYDPERGFFDHHADDKMGKCSALLVTDFFGVRSPGLLTLAWLAQTADKEKDQSRAMDYNPSKQDKASAGILYTLLELIKLWNRDGVDDKKIIEYSDAVINAYFRKRKENEEFSHWLCEGLQNGTISIMSQFGVPTLIAAESPYSSSDLRKLCEQYIFAVKLIVACFRDKNNRIKYGVVKTKNPVPQKLNLAVAHKKIHKRFPFLKTEKDDSGKSELFLHNSGFCLYLNKIPNNFSFVDFAKIALEPQ